LEVGFADIVRTLLGIKLNLLLFSYSRARNEKEKKGYSSHGLDLRFVDVARDFKVGCISFVKRPGHGLCG
jgi:hypothetical protein